MVKPACPSSGAKPADIPVESDQPVCEPQKKTQFTVLIMQKKNVLSSPCSTSVYLCAVFVLVGLYSLPISACCSMTEIQDGWLWSPRPLRPQVWALQSVWPWTALPSDRPPRKLDPGWGWSHRSGSVWRFLKKTNWVSRYIEVPFKVKMTSLLLHN